MAHEVIIQQICQVSITLVTIPMLWLLAQKKDRARKWGYVIGVAHEIFWYGLAWTSGLWSLWALTTIYGSLYLYGFYNHWLRKDV